MSKPRQHKRQPKAIKETGMPNVPASEIEGLHGDDYDTAAMAAGRKFQPPAGRPDPSHSSTDDDTAEVGTGEPAAHTGRHAAGSTDSDVEDWGASVHGAYGLDDEADTSELETVHAPVNARAPHEQPVRHSRDVEERVQQQERDYDLGQTEDGERYVTPHQE